MKKLFLFFTMLLIATNVIAQQVVEFCLKPDGTFQSHDGKSFVVVEYEGKTQQELYNMVKANVLTLYNSPQTVMNEIEPTNITIRALSDKLYSTYALVGAFVEYRARYNYVFQFKDGKIRVDAPLIDSQLNVTASAVPISKTFVSLIDDWFDKKGNVKKKKQKNVSKIEAIFNYPINYLLGNLNQSTKKDEEDW